MPTQAAEAQGQQLEGLRAHLEASKAEARAAVEQAGAAEKLAASMAAERATLEGQLEAVMEGARRVSGTLGCSMLGVGVRGCFLHVYIPGL